MQQKRIDTRRMIFFLSFIMTGALLLSASAAYSSQTGVMQRVREAVQKLDPDKQVKAVIPIPRHIVKVNVPYQGGDFYTDTRKVKLARSDCGACHNNQAVMINNAAKISHADIVVMHGEKDGPIDCNTCHSSVDRNFLTTSKKDKIDIDHVYDMCGQCHFRQKKDWIGGAHGKRITYWAGQRVVQNCTSCHNPHSPKFKKRWPSTYSVPLK